MQWISNGGLLRSHLCRFFPLQLQLRLQSQSFLLAFLRFVSTLKPISFSDNEESEEKPHKVLQLHKSRGQHILTNHRVLKSIIRKSGVRESDTVLEIGPGTGNLTLELLQAAGRVIAVEIDPRMIEILHKRVSGTPFAHKLEVVRGDVMKTELPKFDICVANIPYQISSPLIFKLLSVTSRFRNATLMVQKEFARRLVAKPGDSLFNRLAVNVNLLAKVELLMDVSKRDFTPCPKVDSAVVRIEPRTCPPPVDLAEWDCFTRLCFVRKNKTLGAIFRQKTTVLHLMKKSQLHQQKNSQTPQKLRNPKEPRNPDLDLSLLGESCDDASEAEDTHTEDDMEGGKFVGLKEKIVSVLKDGGFENKRSRKLSEHELLRLIYLFHSEGIQFS